LFLRQNFSYNDDKSEVAKNKLINSFNGNNNG